MADLHESVPAHDDTASTVPDYPLADSLELTGAEQYRALFEDTRSAIVSALLERAATTSQLAEALDRPKGTIGHHLKVLEEAGLVHVVRTERVRALEAKYYGRTARVFWFHREHDAVGLEQRVLARAAAEIPSTRPQDGTRMAANVRYARIPQERVQEWQHRLDELVVEFGTQTSAGATTYALVYGIYPTSRRPLTSDGVAVADEPDGGAGT